MGSVATTATTKHNCQQALEYFNRDHDGASNVDLQNTWSLLQTLLRATVYGQVPCSFSPNSIDPQLFKRRRRCKNGLRNGFPILLPGLPPLARKAPARMSRRSICLGDEWDFILTRVVTPLRNPSKIFSKPFDFLQC